MGVVLKWTGSKTGWGETELVLRTFLGWACGGTSEPGMQDDPMVSALQAIIDRWNHSCNSLCQKTAGWK